MPGISQRGESMPASPIRKLVPFAEAAKSKGINVYHLNIGQPDLATPPAFFEAIRQANIKTLEYSHSAGIESYRRALAQYYTKFGIELTYNQLLITCGGSEAIRFAFMAALNPGDEVIIPEPMYANYLGFAIESGVIVKPIPTDIDNNYALPAAADFEQLITPRTRAILICNPSNPTGKLMPESELEALRELVKKHDLYLIADEVYKEFCYEGAAFYSALRLRGIEDHVVVVDSVSKRYSACGARIGAMITRNEKLLNVALKFAQARLSPPTLGQIGAQALCSLPDTYFESVINEYVARRDVVIAGLAGIPGTYCPKALGAFYLMPRLPIDDADRFCQWLLESFDYHGSTVMLAPGKGFFAHPEAGRQTVRIAYVLEVPALKKAMEALSAAIEKYPGRESTTY